MTSEYDIDQAVLLNLLNHSQTLASILAADGRLMYVNSMPLEIAGLTLDEVIGQKVWETAWWTKEQQPIIKADYEKALVGQVVNRETQLQTLQGQVWIDFNVIPIFDDLGVVTHLVAESRIIDKRKKVEAALRASQDEYNHFFDELDIPFLLLGEEGYEKCNLAAAKMLGYESPEQVLSLKPDELSPVRQPDGQNSIEKAAEMAVLGYKNGSHRFEWRSIKSNGSLLDMDITVTPITFEGQILLHCSWRDLTASNVQKKALEKSEKRYKSIFEGFADATLLLQLETKAFIDCNDAAVKMLGYENKYEMLNMHPRDISPPFQSDGSESIQKINALIKQAFTSGSNRFEWDYKHKSGDIIPVEVLLTVMSVGDENILHVVWRDITDVKRQRNELQQLAHYDSLTGLPNRVLFADRFHLATARSKRTDTILAICFLDLDDFKPINDNFGHGVGDKLLMEVAQRITGCIRDEDTVSRQGGDEFTLLLGGLNSYQECEGLVNRMLQILCEPYIIEGQAHLISASCGITLYPSDDADIDTLVRHADHAMYQAKLEGKNTFSFFDAETEHSSQVHMAFLICVSKAISQGELELHYQPKINMLSGQMFGVEALVRWQHPEDGLIPPAGFLPKIENTEVMISLGQWVIEQALIQIEKWQNQGKEWSVSINIDAYHFMQTGFVEDLRHLLQKYPNTLDGQLEIEILETVAFSDLHQVAGIIRQCQNLGVSFALDDFGTGYSSLAYLKGLPVQWLKIDRSFVRDMMLDTEDLALINGIVLLAKAFKRNIIAEGVETPEQAIALLKLGCQNAQGFGIAKPMPAGQVIAWEEAYEVDEKILRAVSEEAVIQK